MEVGFHGRDVDQIIRDLIEIAINQTRPNFKFQTLTLTLTLTLTVEPARLTPPWCLCRGRQRVRKQMGAEVQKRVEDRILDILTGQA